MMHTVFLFTNNTEPVPYWKNFVMYHNIQYSKIAEVNATLTSYNARFYTSKDEAAGWGDRFLEFENKEDLTMFILRWS